MIAFVDLSEKIYTDESIRLLDAFEDTAFLRDLTMALCTRET